MSHVDHAWLMMDRPNNRMIINGVMMFEDKIDYERLSAILEERLLAYDRFRQRVVEPRTNVGRAYWEEDPYFDIRSHIHRIALPEPGDITALEELVGNMISQPLDRSQPLWEFYVVENYDGGSAVIGRFHHCIADGIALVRVMLSLTDAAPDAGDGSRKRKRKQGGFVPFGSLVRRAGKLVDTALDLSGLLVSHGWEIVTNPSHIFDLADKGAQVALDSADIVRKLLLAPPDNKTLFKGELGVAKRVAWATRIPLSDVKKVKTVMDATVNDVLVAAVTGALRRYLIEHGDSPDGKEIRAMVPVNIRPPSDTIELGNRFALVNLSLPIGLEDSLDRLFEVKRRMDHIKQSPEPIITYQLLNTLGLTPGDLASQLINFFATKASLVLTNVPGPQQPLYIAGSKLKEQVFWVPQSASIGMGISIFSYAGEITLGVLTDEKIVPDPHTIVDYFYDEFQDLLYLAELPEMSEVVQTRRTAVQAAKSAETAAPAEQAIPIEEAAADSSTTEIAEALFSQYMALKEDPEPWRCRAETKRGDRCKNRVIPNSRYCRIHQEKAQTIPEDGSALEPAD
jgi:WS/DGAT/MGAT family acyltransferase